MERREFPNLRLYILSGFVLLVLLIYLGVLYDTQVNDHEDYLAQSIRTITQPETVEASRGIVTDRNGQVLVSNRSTYSLTFSTSLLKSGEDVNEAILRLVRLCQKQEVTWVDNLPISQTAPFSYTLEGLDSIQRGRFLTYLLSLDDVAEPLGAYLLQHPGLLEQTDEDGTVTNAADEILADATLTDQQKGAKLAEKLPSSALTEELLTAIGISAHKLVELMRASFELPAIYSLNEARLVLGVRYELKLRSLIDNIPSYVMAEDIDTAFVSMLSDGNFAGAKVSASSVREYQTAYAAHILGYTTGIQSGDDMEALREKGYNSDDKIGRTGVEAAFEEYLRGRDGVRIVSTNADGKITGEYYSKEPEPGNTVELTIDLDLQKTVEDALAATITRMNQQDPDETRGGAAVVEQVGTGEILAIASYPTYDLSTWRRSDVYAQLSADKANPFWNRATSTPYAPGSTLKPLTAVAALESGATTLTEKIRDTGRWYYPGDPNSYTNCWKTSGHGLLNVTGAITNSCNYFFAEMGYRMGMDTFVEYLSAFGLGSPTGIEIGDAAGTLPENPPGQNLAPWAAYGQANQEYTPLQLANYVATLVSGGKHCEAHLLKAVKSYDNSQVLATGNTEALNTVKMADSTLEAVKEGMLGYTQPGGQLYTYFTQCVVTAGAKTGTAQLGGDQTNNGVFVCFAPYDDPEIVVSIAIEHGSAGANLASTAVELLNAYFTADEVGTAVIGEHQLLE